MDKMKTLYVFGDSYMTQDANYPSEHWSEMTPGYHPVIRSQSGCSNSMIVYQAFQAINESPDAVVIGFTSQLRLNFDMPADGIKDHQGRQWYNNGAIGYITQDQRLACDYYAATVSERMALFETYCIIRSLFLTLQQHQIPFAWNPMILDNNIANPRCKTQDWLEILGEFEPKKILLNLAQYQIFKDSPGFHTHNSEWQTAFAIQSMKIIQQQVDFYKK
jgi:hypothetical protein